MDISKGKALFEQCLQDPYIRKCYDLGDARRSGQTKHGFREHAVPVAQEAQRISSQVRQHHPGLIDDWTHEVIIPFGALLHDIGGCNSIENHDKEGAKLMRKYLRTLHLQGDKETLSGEDQERICRIIAYHRAGRYLKYWKLKDPALDVVLLADKSIGDEDRVRPGRAFCLRILTWFGLASIPLRHNGEHDRINFAIHSSRLVADTDGNMVLKFEVKDAVLQDSRLLFWLPKRDSIYSVIYEHEYYKKNFHAMEQATRSLGYGFFLEFNGTRYGFNKKSKIWQPV